MMVECYKSRVGNTEREMLRLQDDNGVPRCPKDAKKMTAPCIAVVNKAKKDSASDMRRGKERGLGLSVVGETPVVSHECFMYAI